MIQILSLYLGKLTNLITTLITTKNDESSIKH